MSEMSWMEAFESEGGQSETMSEGYHRAKIVRTMRFKKNGDELRTDKGGPYVMLVFENAQGAQAACNLWISPQAKWKLAKTCQRLGMDLRKMDEAGVSINRFEDEKFCAVQFEGREGWLQVTHRDKYANAEVVDEANVPVELLQRQNKPASGGWSGDHAPITEDDIPFDSRPAG